MNSVVKNGYAYPTLFEGFFGKDSMNELFAPAYNGTSPAVNVIEHTEGYRIEVAAPGMQKEDFKLDLNNNKLTISAQREQKEEKENMKYTRREFKYASFQRTFTLPATIDSERIEATYTDGILSIELPKREEAKVKPVRQIEIK
ncbi:Hsp20/alpha crystallin family protein [Telluribacter sp. SYSU D00476]|uniref:Hsp20/alpha crystallin family protein n=1 Tax=Telluribacter sp. SYSU D00476 TaxID=2811430 RepID=UPI001FF44BEC|nr:Hsp20/alpha crystallin family protein [Telluribacter sp. SYSU D00476]